MLIRGAQGRTSLTAWKGLYETGCDNRRAWQAEGAAGAKAWSCDVGKVWGPEGVCAETWLGLGGEAPKADTLVQTMNCTKVF